MNNSIPRKEIEEKIENMGDYVRMDYLSDCLKKHLDFDTRKFVILKLAGIYEERKMFNDAGKLMRGGAEINTTFRGKITDFLKSGELFIRAGNFDDAEISFDRAIASADSKQRDEIKNVKKEYYKTQAKASIIKDKRNNAMVIYEKMLSLELNFGERREIQKELLELYKQLGKVREYFSLKKTIEK